MHSIKEHAICLAITWHTTNDRHSTNIVYERPEFNRLYCIAIIHFLHTLEYPALQKPIEFRSIRFRKWNFRDCTIKAIPYNINIGLQSWLISLLIFCLALYWFIVVLMLWKIVQTSFYTTLNLFMFDKITIVIWN